MENLHTVDLMHAGKPRKVSVQTDRYTHGGGLAVQLIDEEDGLPYATVSVNVNGVPLEDGEFVFKTYSENEGLIEEMIRSGIVETTGRFAEIGPICRLLAQAETDEAKR
jgi:hypothetical protein